MGTNERVRRILELGQALIDSRHGVVIEQYAKKHGHSRSALYRDIDVLRSLSFPIRSEHGRHWLPADFQIFGRNGLDADEIEQLYIARQFAGRIPGTRFDRSLASLWSKVTATAGQPSLPLPSDATLSVAAFLDVARRMFAVIGRLQGTAATRAWLTAVDVFHIEKDGNNVRVRSVSRIDLRRDRANMYGVVREKYWSPLFRRRRITSLLDDDRPWWIGFGRLCATSPQELTIEDSKFRHDCRIAFTEVEMTEADRNEEKTLEQLIYDVVRTYVFGRLESKYDLKWEKNVKGKGADREKEYNDKKEKIAREAFLAVRSRTGAAFVSYFTGTICSVSQWLNKAGYLELARALAPGNDEQIERVRSLTLLALSATA